MKNFEFKAGQVITDNYKNDWVVFMTIDNHPAAVCYTKDRWSSINVEDMELAFSVIAVIREAPHTGLTDGKIIWTREKDFKEEITLEDLSKREKKTIVVRDASLAEKYLKVGNVVICDYNSYLVLGNGDCISKSGHQSFSPSLDCGKYNNAFKIHTIFVNVSFCDGFDSAIAGYEFDKIVRIYDSIEEIEKEYDVRIAR